MCDGSEQRRLVIRLQFLMLSLSSTSLPLLLSSFQCLFLSLFFHSAALPLLYPSTSECGGNLDLLLRWRKDIL
ncbi:uncharacterized protein BJ171DRAFT_491962, partial [Polychytrium aggregatum]|uniref:uncharacterized protein n=1 Tax=Polychytrium aggregatum TaxID=110093 RepID=UPI0022FE620B